MAKNFPQKDDPLMLLMEAMLFGNSSDAIVNSEKRGQREFVNSEVLPKKCNFCSRQQLEQMGIVFGEDADDLFVFVTLPDGWKKEATDHDMWSYLLDDKGRKRAAIFYKAAFYDRDAHISLERRYSYGCRPVHGWVAGGYNNDTWHGVATDCQEVIWHTDPMEKEPEYKTNEKAWHRWYENKQKLADLAKNWLNEHFPEWENPLAYWER